jgi:triosephosphate isomerase
MKRFYQKSKLGRTAGEIEDQTVALDFDDEDDRWIIDIEVDNIITNISENRTRNIEDEEKAKELGKVCLTCAVEGLNERKTKHMAPELPRQLRGDAADLSKTA